MNYYSNVNFYYEDFLMNFIDTLTRKLNILLKNYHYKIIKVMKPNPFILIKIFNLDLHEIQ